jgi:hypothetical protein
VLHELARESGTPEADVSGHPVHDCDSGSEKGTVKDVQGVMRHSRTATTTECLHAGDSRERAGDGRLHQSELRKSSRKSHRKTVKTSPEAVALEAKVLKRGAVSVRCLKI